MDDDGHVETDMVVRNGIGGVVTNEQLINCGFNQQTW